MSVGYASKCATSKRQGCRRAPKARAMMDGHLEESVFKHSFPDMRCTGGTDRRRYARRRDRE